MPHHHRHHHKSDKSHRSHSHHKHKHRHRHRHRDERVEEHVGEREHGRRRSGEENGGKGKSSPRERERDYERDSKRSRISLPVVHDGVSKSEEKREEIHVSAPSIPHSIAPSHCQSSPTEVVITNPPEPDPVPRRTLPLGPTLPPSMVMVSVAEEESEGRGERQDQVDYPGVKTTTVIPDRVGITHSGQAAHVVGPRLLTDRDVRLNLDENELSQKGKGKRKSGRGGEDEDEDGQSTTELKRDDWMTELPDSHEISQSILSNPLAKANFKPRQFTGGSVGHGDTDGMKSASRDMWTAVPGQEGKKERGEGGRGRGRGRGQLVTKEDMEYEAFVRQYNEKWRSESLVEQHRKGAFSSQREEYEKWKEQREKEREKEGGDEGEGEMQAVYGSSISRKGVSVGVDGESDIDKLKALKPSQRAFNRELDLESYRKPLDERQQKSILSDAMQLNNRFSSGKAKRFL